MNRRFVLGVTLATSVLACSAEKAEGVPSEPAKKPSETPHGPNLAHDPLGSPPADAQPVETFGPPVDVQPSGEVRVERAAELSFDVPVEWVTSPPKSGMRLAELELPGPGGGASLKVFRFRSAGGSAMDNVDRWVGQMAQPDGSDSSKAAVIEKAERDGLTFTRVDVRGRFAGQSLPGAPAMAAIEEARLIAFVVEGSGDPFFFKLVGPATTVDVWAAAFAKTAESAKVAG